MTSKSRTTTKTEDLRPLSTPGGILQREFIEPAGLTVNSLALALRVPATRLHAIVKGKRAITADTALRLARYFGMSAQFFMNLQTNYDLRLAERAKALEIEADVVPRPTGHLITRH